MNEQTRPQQHIMMENWRASLGEIRTPNGAPCEKCGEPSVWTLKRREHFHSAGTGGDCTRPVNDAKEHPRCKAHLYPGDASLMDAE